MKNVIYVTLVVFVSEWHRGHASCTDQDIATCAAPLSAFNLTAAPIVPTRAKDEMKNLCRAYDEVEQCLGSIESYCDNDQRLKMKTVDNQYDYICDNTFDEYLKHRECLANKDLHSDAMKCNVTLTEHYAEIPISNKSWSYKRDRLCQYAYQYINCIFVSVRGYCGEKAAEWQKGLDMLTVMPAFSSLNCPIFQKKAPAPENDTTMIIVAVIVVGVACLVLVGGMTAFFIHRKRKADQKRAAHEMLNMTRRDPRHQHASQPSTRNEDNMAAAPATPPANDFLAPPPYLEKDVPPPSYRNPPNYDALFADTVGATGVSLSDDFPKGKV